MIVPTGALMFVAHATEFAGNPAFRLKLILLVAAALNAAVFHLRPFRRVAEWDHGAIAPPHRTLRGGMFAGAVDGRDRLRTAPRLLLKGPGQSPAASS